MKLKSQYIHIGLALLLTASICWATVPTNGTAVYFQDGSGNPSQEVASKQSGTWTVQPGNTANTTAWKVDGSASTQPVSGTFWPATQPVSGTVTANAGTGTFTVSKDISTGRTAVMKTGSLTTTAATADQVVLTYTVTSGKTLYLEYVTISARFTILSTVGALMGAASLEAPSGTKGITDTFTNPTIEEPERITIPFSEPLALAAGSVVRIVCTPSGATSTLWTANLGGYEK